MKWRRRRGFIAGLTVLLCALGAAPAGAHTKSETHTVWQIIGKTVHLTFTMPIVEANRLAANGVLPPPNGRITEYLTAHVSVTSKAGPCPAHGPAHAVAATPQFRRFEMSFQCPGAQELLLHSSAFFELVPSHVTFAQIETDRGEFVEQLFTRDHQAVAASAATGGELASASFFKYVQLGIMHIFTGVDHMSFLLGLVLISRRVRDLAFVITGFTLGHSATLALAVTGIIRPHAEFIDALVALTIAVIGAENIAVATHRPGIVALGLGSLLLSMALVRIGGRGAAALDPAIWGWPFLLLLPDDLGTAAGFGTHTAGRDLDVRAHPWLWIRLGPARDAPAGAAPGRAAAGLQSGC